MKSHRRSTKQPEAAVALAAAAIVSTLVLAPATGLAQGPAPDGWSVPRTAAGHPDLQGVWANNNATPLARPDEWAGKERLTDEELANVMAAADRVVESGENAQFGDQLILAALAELRDAPSYDSTGNYNQFWMADRDFSHQTSLVIDPPDGQVPELTADAVARAEARRGYLEEHPADGPEDRQLGERCANFGVPRIGAG